MIIKVQIYTAKGLRPFDVLIIIYLVYQIGREYQDPVRNVQNELVLELAILSYNILRMIGQESPGKRNPHLKRTVKRRRHRTVINNLINMACHVTEHARKLIIGLGKSNVWRDVFRHVYYAFEYFAL